MLKGVIRMLEKALMDTRTLELRTLAARTALAPRRRPLRRTRTR
jgi:hypothetical protein